VAGVFLLGNPFAIIDFKAFYGSMRYESSVATGSLPVFYTGTFHGTVPLLFQALYVLPFLLNPIVWFVLLPALVILLLKQVKSDQQEYRIVLIFIIFLFLPQAVLYVKWTRYMVPLLPVLYLILVIALASLHRYLKKYSFLKNLVPAVCITLVIASIIWSFSFVKTVYFDPDTRVQAAEIISLQEKPTQRVLSEVYDMGIVPFDTAFSTISLFNFYDLENDPDIRSNLPTALSHNDLLILPSQRIIKSRIMNEDIFPYGHNFYQSVLTSSRYSQIYQTPCDIWCMLVYLGDPVYGVEDTANVFDRPTIHIYSIE
jgi:hypothetical protein